MGDLRALGALLLLLAPADLFAGVKLVRRGDGAAVIFNDVGSGWTVHGGAPTDRYLLARREAETPFDDAIRRHADQEGVDPGLVRSVILVESNFNPRAVSRKGACGLMQLMPATARRYGVSNSFDAAENIRGGVRYLADLLGLFHGDLTLALAAYNAGEGAVARYGTIPPYRETQEYVRRALLVYRGADALPVLTGGFRGLDVVPAALRVRRPVRSAPVSLSEQNGVRLLSNQPLSSRPAPILGRAK